ncbi:MAG: DUF2283 domain-containing protein [Chloroflexi bacterium]|nr:DUF2283 domain-containing protein [Chloroflexota bacterium]
MSESQCERIIESSGNVFADLGFGAEEADVLQTRARLIVDLKEYLQAAKTKPIQARYFDREGVLHLLLKEGEESDHFEFDPDVIAELNAEGDLIGLEFIGNRGDALDSLQKRCRELTAKQRSDLLSDEEQMELDALIDRIEGHNIQQIGFLAQCAELTGMSLDAVMSALTFETIKW